MERREAGRRLRGGRWCKGRAGGKESARRCCPGRRHRVTEQGCQSLRGSPCQPACLPPPPPLHPALSSHAHLSPKTQPPLTCHHCHAITGTTETCHGGRLEVSLPNCGVCFSHRRVYQHHTPEGIARTCPHTTHIRPQATTQSPQSLPTQFVACSKWNIKCHAHVFLPALALLPPSHSPTPPHTRALFDLFQALPSSWYFPKSLTTHSSSHAYVTPSSPC